MIFGETHGRVEVHKDANEPFGHELQRQSGQVPQNPPTSVRPSTMPRKSTITHPLSPLQACSVHLYRCTEFVTYTVSSVFAIGYAISGVLDPLRVADSRVPKPWREGARG
jgi:hypothetical protein